MALMLMPSIMLSLDEHGDRAIPFADEPRRFLALGRVRPPVRHHHAGDRLVWSAGGLQVGH